MKMLAEFPNMKLYWYDEEQTILIGEIDKGWTWQVAHEGLHQLNKTVDEQTQIGAVYVILHFLSNTEVFPKGSSTVRNMWKVLSDDPSNETMTICVAKVNIIATIIALTSRIYRATHNQSKYRYVTTFERALEIVESHKGKTKAE